jgi:hypothetical protein
VDLQRFLAAVGLRQTADADERVVLISASEARTRPRTTASAETLTL